MEWIHVQSAPEEAAEQLDFFGSRALLFVAMPQAQSVFQPRVFRSEPFDLGRSFLVRHRGFQPVGAEALDNINAAVKEYMAVATWECPGRPAILSSFRRRPASGWCRMSRQKCGGWLGAAHRCACRKQAEPASIGNADSRATSIPHLYIGRSLVMHPIGPGLCPSVRERHLEHLTPERRADRQPLEGDT